MPVTVTPDTIYALRPLTKAAGETRVFAVDFSLLLPADVLLTGTPTATISPSGPTVSSVAVNTSALTDSEGNTIAIGEAVQFQVAGGSRGRHEITVLCAADNGETLGGRCILLVDA